MYSGGFWGKEVAQARFSWHPLRWVSQAVANIALVRLGRSPIRGEQSERNHVAVACGYRPATDRTGAANIQPCFEEPSHAKYA